ATLIEDPGTPDPVAPNAREHPVGELPHEILIYLLNSRYCEVDRLSNIASDLFGATAPGWGRVQAICNWVNWGIHFTQVAPIGCGFESCSPERSPRSTCKWLALQPLPAGRVGKTACPGGASSDG